jgi:hypothetical protein
MSKGKAIVLSRSNYREFEFRRNVFPYDYLNIKVRKGKGTIDIGVE